MDHGEYDRGLHLKSLETKTLVTEGVIDDLLHLVELLLVRVHGGHVLCLNSLVRGGW